MEIGKRIKDLRLEKSFSQDDLAMKIYVSRQTISNWENDKNYPDVKSLILLSSLFNVSLDKLIKGDVEKMKEMINSEEMRIFRKDSSLLTILFVTLVIAFAPLIIYAKTVGIIILVFITALMLYYAYRVEKHKKRFNIQTYKEIVTFFDGKELDINQVQQELGKRAYQKILITVVITIVTVLIVMGLLFLFSSI